MHMHSMVGTTLESTLYYEYWSIFLLFVQFFARKFIHTPILHNNQLLLVTPHLLWSLTPQ